MKKQGIRKRLMTTITLSVAFAILIVSVLACIVAVSNHQDEKKQAVSYSLESSKNIMESWFNGKITLIKFMAMNAVNRDFYNNYDECLSFLQSCAAMDDDIFDCYLGYEDKYYVFGSEYHTDDYDPTSRVWYKMASASGTPIVTAPYTDVQTARMVITISTKFTTKDNIAGVISIDVFLDTLSEYVSSLHVDENGYALLMTDDGSIIVHKNTEYQAVLDAAGNDVFTNIADVMKGYSANMDTSGLPFVTDYTGSSMRYGESVLDSTGWKLGYVLNVSEYNYIYLIIITMFVVLSAAAIIFNVIWIYFQLKMAFAPLKDISEKAEEVARGTLDVTFSYGADDEIGQVCRTIENNNASMKSYINDISYRLEGIAHGDFGRGSGTEYIGDYVSIKQSLDRISAALAQVFNGIESASGDVSTGANDVANGSSHLAETVSKQTELIENIVQDIGAVSDNIENNVTGTDDARSIALETAQAVNTGAEQMNHLLGAMDEISSASEEIKKIISAIEDIAFQTNILALNASIEAARAGEAGKGFAVVADEVRNLAAKSADASEQTAQLIERSVAAVTNGRSIADETSESLRRVVEHTEKIDRIIVSINEASHEQRTQMISVNEKVGLVSDYVTSAAANAEQSAAAAEELNSQAASLRDIIRSYKK